MFNHLIILSEGGGSLPIMDPNQLGLLFWTLFIFLVTWIILGKVAFKPIGKALKSREEGIEKALKSAEQAREEMASLKSENDAILKEAKEERAAIIREAQAVKKGIIDEAKEAAQEEAAKIMQRAEEELTIKREAMMAELRNTSAQLALDIAKRVLERELEGEGKQQKYAEDLAKKAKLN